ncbi:unnamed protein product [Ectocarpus sp. CCAP 1310/34]|nr:unnamed protein product [Ectocarpus sp. CCAP 1310/34]
MSGDLPAVEQSGSLAPTHQALEREGGQVEIERREAGDAVREKRLLRNASGRHERQSRSYKRTWRE